MAQVTENTWVEDPTTGAPVFLAEGDDVPSWADGLVGKHLLDGDGDGASDDPTAYKAQTIPELQKAVDVRNADRDGDAVIVVEGTGKNGAVRKDDLIKALEADDAKIAQVEADSGSGGSGGDATVSGANGGSGQ